MSDKEFELPIKACPDCGGDGKIKVFYGHVASDYCQTCKGKGYIER